VDVCDERLQVALLLQCANDLGLSLPELRLKIALQEKMQMNQVTVQRLSRA